MEHFKKYFYKFSMTGLLSIGWDYPYFWKCSYDAVNIIAREEKGNLFQSTLLSWLLVTNSPIRNPVTNNISKEILASRWLLYSTNLRLTIILCMAKIQLLYTIKECGYGPHQFKYIQRKLINYSQYYFLIAALKSHHHI